nr:MAG TPA: hypothetical protein [Caudoviricetes sp.]
MACKALSSQRSQKKNGLAEAQTQLGNKLKSQEY